MRIGNLKLENPFVQASMAGVTDAPFRTIARRFHSGLMFTEMVSAEALCRGEKRTMSYARIDDVHHPVGLQLVGHMPERMAEAARAAEKLGADFIDINAACPKAKVTRQGAGGALLKEPEKLVSILKNVKRAVDIPVSIKLRLGYDFDNCLHIAGELEDAGADFLTIHGRLVADKFDRESDWQALKNLVEEVSIPILANGGASCEDEAVRMLETTGAEGVAIGRATRGRPDLPGTAFSLLARGSYDIMGPELLAETVRDHAALEIEVFGEPRGMRRMRKHVNWYLRAAGVRCPSRDIYELETIGELDELIRRHILV